MNKRQQEKELLAEIEKLPEPLRLQLLENTEEDNFFDTTSKIDIDLIFRLQQLEPYKRFSWDDKGFGELFANFYKEQFRFNATSKNWMFYNGKYWEEDPGGMYAARLGKQLATHLYEYASTIEDQEQREKYSGQVYKLGSYRARETMIKDARDVFFLKKEDLDKDIFLFNCQNGTIDLRTFEFREHNPDDLLSKISNVVYDPAATSPEFEKFMWEVMQGNVEKIDYLQKLFGHSLTGDVQAETCYMLYGATTRNGKGTLVETFAYMLGNSDGYATGMKPETLAQKKNTDSRQASGDIARLKGCRFLNVSEPDKKMIFNVALLKTLLGRDTIVARHLHQSEFEFIPVFKLFINTNHLPLIADDTVFSSGRINVITFDRHFEEHERDTGLKDRLREEHNISGIFNWCLEGLKRYYQHGEIPPQAVKEATDDYRSDSDKVKNFIEDCLEPSQMNTKVKDVYAAYQWWCSLNGFGAENGKNFKNELNAKGLFAKTGTVEGVTYHNVVKGMVLKNAQSLSTVTGCEIVKPPPPNDPVDFHRRR